MLRHTKLNGRSWSFGVTVITLALVAVVAWGNDGLSGPAAALAQEAITVTMEAENNSGQDGEAILIASGNDTEVSISPS